MEGARPTCRFHHPEIGCRLPLTYRNTVCRQFLCPDIKLWQDRRAKRWVDFWLRLQEEEIRCQQLLSDECSKDGCSLLVRRRECLELVRDRSAAEIGQCPAQRLPKSRIDYPGQEQPGAHNRYEVGKYKMEGRLSSFRWSSYSSNDLLLNRKSDLPFVIISDLPVYMHLYIQALKHGNTLEQWQIE